MTKSDLDSRYAAKTLSADLLPWERQPDETEGAYQAFKAWLDSDKRRVSDHGASAKNWSAQWSWSRRAHEYDVYMSRVDLEEQVRYRRRMMTRHRQVASVAQSKVVQWLNGLDLAKMTTADATRLLDVSVKIEREACPAVAVEDLPDLPYEPPRERDGGLKQRLIDAGVDEGKMPEVARLLHELESLVSASEQPPEPPRFPVPRRQPQADAPRQAQDDEGPVPQPGEGTPPSIWGDT